MTNRHFGFPLTFFQRAVTRCHQGARASMKGNTPDRPSSHLNQYPGTKRVCGGQTDAADTPRKCSDHTHLLLYGFQPKESAPDGRPGSISQSRPPSHSQCVSALPGGQTAQACRHQNTKASQWAMLVTQQETMPTTMEHGVLCHRRAHLCLVPRGSVPKPTFSGARR